MKPKTKLIAGLVVLFLAGVVIGAVGTGLYIKSQLTHFYKGGREKRVEMIVGRLSRKLDLTEQQKMRVADILREDFKKSGPDRAELMKRRIDQRMAKIRELLTEDQLPKLEEHRRELFARIDRRFQEK